MVGLLLVFGKVGVDADNLRFIAKLDHGCQRLVFAGFAGLDADVAGIKFRHVGLHNVEHHGFQRGMTWTHDFKRELAGKFPKVFFYVHYIHGSAVYSLGIKQV